MLPNLSPFIRNRVHHHNLNRQHYKRGVEKYAVLQSGEKYEERGVSLQHCSFPSCSNIPSATAGKKNIWPEIHIGGWGERGAQSKLLKLGIWENSHGLAEKEGLCGFKSFSRLCQYLLLYKPWKEIERLFCLVSPFRRVTENWKGHK